MAHIGGSFRTPHHGGKRPVLKRPIKRPMIVHVSSTVNRVNFFVLSVVAFIVVQWHSSSLFSVSVGLFCRPCSFLQSSLLVTARLCLARDKSRWVSKEYSVLMSESWCLFGLANENRTSKPKILRHTITVKETEPPKMVQWNIFKFLSFC